MKGLHKAFVRTKPGTYVIESVDKGMPHMALVLRRHGKKWNAEFNLMTLDSSCFVKGDLEPTWKKAIHALSDKLDDFRHLIPGYLDQYCAE